MSIFKDGQSYYGTHYWWDVDDNEYILCATWKFEKGYDMPDMWHLEDLEVEQYDGRYISNSFSCHKGTNVWRDIEREGCPMDAEEVDYS